MASISSKIKLRPEDILDEEHMSEAVVTYLQDSGIRDIQRFHSGLRRFASKDRLTFTSGFKSKYKCISAKPEQVNDNPRIWSAQWKCRSDDSVRTLKVFSKVIHLIEPITFQQRSHILSYMPAPDSAERDELRRHAISRHNQASVDATVCYILSCLGGIGVTPHAIQYLETICGIADSYDYKITDDYMSFRQSGWFWSMAEGGAKLKVSGLVPDEIREWILTQPTDESMIGGMIESDSSWSLGAKETVEVSLDVLQLESIEEAAKQPCEVIECGADFEIGALSPDNNEPTELFRVENASCKPSISEEAMDCLEAVNGDIYLKCKNIPVLVCFQEAADGTMDELLREFECKEDDEEDDDNYGIIDDEAAEEKWSAYLFQVVAALSVFQKFCHFCHNDLHTNNIVWTATDQQFLYYKNENADYYKVPTFGKLFKIIDFGRATCEIGDKKVMSSDFAPGQDAAGQYNWGPFYTEGMPEVEPNPSFDLCRLAVSLFDSLCPDEEAREDSALAKLLWKWMLDDNEESVLLTDEGEERFPGFELYIHIASSVHGAVPSEQFGEKPFSRFKWKGKAMRAAAAKVQAYPIYTYLSDIDETLRD